ncbi:hypothetical protein BKI52_45070 [marine bacterium AO1-C]|nr:hypothetical protein BKI52_45070 [marine bacterium AO1-C]
MQTKLERQADELWKGYKEESSRFWKQYDKLIQNAQQKAQRKVIPKEQTPDVDISVAYEAVSKFNFTFYKYEKKGALGFKMSLQTGLLSLIAGILLGVSVPGTIELYIVVCAIAFSNLEYRYFDTPMPRTVKKLTLEFRPDVLVITSEQSERRLLYKDIRQVKAKKREIIVKAKSGKELRIPLYNQQLEKVPKNTYQPLLQFFKLIIQKNKQGKR